MWLFTKYGFFSLSCENDDVMVRARVESHLQNLQNKFPILGYYQIQDTHNRDYQYRIFVPKKVWAEVSVDLMNDMDYSKFKPAAKECLDKIKDSSSQEYSRMLLDAWYLIFDYFPNEQYMKRR